MLRRSPAKRHTVKLVTEFRTTIMVNDGNIAALGVLRAGVEDVRDTVHTADHREAGDDSFCPPNRAPALALERIAHDDEALEREGHHVPDGQEAANAARVRKQLTVGFACVDVHLKEAKPGDEQSDQYDDESFFSFVLKNTSTERMFPMLPTTTSSGM
uniref:Uncharacterized protein n=1 Tax=Anopheles farauti TaxID=69004 RepID=A0A182QVY5_9DIPT